MEKTSFFKQAMISVLITIILCLALAIAFYQYLPSNKVIPTKVKAYATPQNIISEVTEDATEQEFKSQEFKYDITDHDLEVYQRAKTYNPGKSDPFAEYTEEPSSANSTEGGTTTPSGNTGNGNNGTANTNNTDNYYHSAGISNGGK